MHEMSPDRSRRRREPGEAAACPGEPRRSGAEREGGWQVRLEKRSRTTAPGGASGAVGTVLRTFALDPGPVIALAVLTLSAGWTSPGAARPAQLQEDGTFWESDVSTALRAAAKSSQWVLVYFPDTRSSDLAQPPEGDAIARRLEGTVLGAHVGSDDAMDRIRDLEVSRLPALVLLDSEGLVVHRWLDRWTARDVVATFRAQEKRFAELREEVADLLAAAETALEAGEDREAVKRCAQAGPMTREGSRDRKRLLAILARVQERGERALIVALAAEGIQSDYRLIRTLEDLKKRYPLSRFARMIDREIERLKDRKIAGHRS